MLLFASSFAVGTAIFHRSPRLPDDHWLIAAALSIVVFACLAWVVRRWRPACLVATALVFGFSFSHLFALSSAPATLEMPAQRLTLDVTGTVHGLPQRRGQMTRFVIETRDRLPGANPPERPQRFRLSWRDAPELVPGDTWRMTVRLKAARGFASPGAWDYERWLYQRGIRYTGYVLNPGSARRVAAAACCRIDRWRHTISGRLDALPLSAFSRGVLRALVVADRSGLEQRAQTLFQMTGTSHLMAVSGLHIGLVSGGVMLVTGWLWRRAPALCSRVPAKLAAAAAGLVAAALYAALAGFGLPTQRALIMLFVFAGAVLFRRQSSPVNALAMAAIAVLLWHPPSILEPGFWLSFGAVATILATLRWMKGRPGWLAAIVVQLALTIALWPVLLAAGLPASGISPLVNLVMVPLFGVLIVPWSLLGGLATTASPAMGTYLLWPLGELLDAVALLLEFATLRSSPLPGLGPEALWLLLFAVCLLLIPPGLPFRWAGLPLLLLPWLPRSTLVGPGDFQFHLLDVGQGLSAIVETRRHVLVFDTGPAYPSGFSTADAVVLPFLRHRSHGAIDHLMISHGDSDHGGGLAVLREAVEIAELSGGEPERSGPGVNRCSTGQHWVWDGVHFSVIHPDSSTSSTGNNASCVLRIQNRAGTLLLTGDIEAQVERRLVDKYPQGLQATVVVAPHHGSRSSSTPGFIDAVGAEHVLFAAGWANRYGFPDREIVQRWRAAGSEVHETAKHGTLSFRFTNDGQVYGPDRYRIKQRRFWSASAE